MPEKLTEIYTLSSSSAYPDGIFTSKAHLATALLSLPREERLQTAITAYPLNKLDPGQAVDLDEIPGVAERTLTDQELDDDLGLLIGQTLTGWINDADKTRLNALKTERDRRQAENER